MLAYPSSLHCVFWHFCYLLRCCLVLFCVFIMNGSWLKILDLLGINTASVLTCTSVSACWGILNLFITSSGGNSEPHQAGRRPRSSLSSGVRFFISLYPQQAVVYRIGSCSPIYKPKYRCRGFHPQKTVHIASVRALLCTGRRYGLLYWFSEPSHSQDCVIILVTPTRPCGESSLVSNNVGTRTLAICLCQAPCSLNEQF
jgi:hypothetical protein